MRQDNGYAAARLARNLLKLDVPHTGTCGAQARDMTETTDRLTRIANRQILRATGDILFGLLYVGGGLGSFALLLCL